MKRHCQNCNRIFFPSKGNLAQGYGKYCTRACRNTGAGLGFKTGHGRLRKNYADALKKEQHPQWKGDEAGKVAKHAFIERIKGKPQACELCLTKANRIYDWANVDHKYSRNPDDYIRLCRPCHRKFDYEKQYA